ncbi:8241_t:CDS:2, partial [Gigaspora rosea]
INTRIENSVFIIEWKKRRSKEGTDKWMYEEFPVQVRGIPKVTALYNEVSYGRSQSYYPCNIFPTNQHD